MFFLKFLTRIKFKIHFAPKPLNSCKTHNVKPWKIAFYGTDELSVVTLKALNINRTSSDCDKVVEHIDVICIKSDCAVRRYASLNHLTVFTWPYDLPKNTYDVGVVVSFGHMIPSDSIFACKFGMINGHPSLLPRWKGGAPIIHAILNGDRETGVTITEVSPNKFDVGRILLQEKHSIPSDCSSKELTDALSKVTANMLMKALSDLPNYLLKAVPQSEEKQSYARKIKPQQGNIDWKRDSSVEIWRKYKAFSGFIDIYTHWKDLRIALLEFAPPGVAENAKISTLTAEMDTSEGFCYFHKRRKVIFVKCQSGWCGILSIRIPKRGCISAQDFYNGFMSKEKPDECYVKYVLNTES